MTSNRMTVRVTVAIVLLLAAAVAVARADRQEDVPLRTSFGVFPMQIGEWTGMAQTPFTQEIIDVLGVDDYVTRAYFLPDRSGVGLYIGYWASQRQGDTIHSPLNCLPGAGWEPISQSIIQVPDPRRPDGGTVPVNRVLIQKGLERQLVYYWYQSHGRIVADEYRGRFYLMLDAARLNRTDGAMIRVLAPVRNETPAAEAEAERLAARFTQELLPELGAFLPE